MQRPNTVRNLLVAGGVLTATLHGGIEALTNYGHGPRVEASDFNPFVDETVKTTNAGTVPAGEPYVEVVPGTEHRDQSPKDLHRQELNLTGGAYARHFDEDPMAGVLEQQSIDSFVETVNGYMADGWDVAIHVRGLASAEDASLDGLAGVQTPSNDNQRLANTRRDAFVGALVEAGIQESSVVLEDGAEGQLTNSQLGVIRAFATQFGYQSVDALIQAYNDNPNAMPPVVNATLDTWLDDERGVSAVMVATRQVAGTGYDQPTEREVCILPVLQVIRKDVTRESWKLTVPYGVAVGLGAMALSTVATIVSGVGMMARDIRGYRGASGSGDAGGAGGNGAQKNLPKIIEDNDPAETTTTPPNEPEPDDPEKKGCIGLPWGKIALIPFLIAGATLAIRSCDNNTPPTPHSGTEKPADPCAGLERRKKVVGVKTITTRNGRSAVVRVKPAN